MTHVDLYVGFNNIRLIYVLDKYCSPQILVNIKAHIYEYSSVKVQLPENLQKIACPFSQMYYWLFSDVHLKIWGFMPEQILLGKYSIVVIQVIRKLNEWATHYLESILKGYCNHWKLRLAYVINVWIIHISYLYVYMTSGYVIISNFGVIISSTKLAVRP